MDPDEKQTIQAAATLRVLVASEGWKHLERIIKTHLRERERIALQSYSVARSLEPNGLSREDHYEMVAEQKGAILAFRLVLQTPGAIIESADDILSRIPPEHRHVIEENLE